MVMGYLTKASAVIEPCLARRYQYLLVGCLKVNEMLQVCLRCAYKNNIGHKAN